MATRDGGDDAKCPRRCVRQSLTDASRGHNSERVTSRRVTPPRERRASRARPWGAMRRARSSARGRSRARARASVSLVVLGTSVFVRSCDAATTYVTLPVDGSFHGEYESIGRNSWRYFKFAVPTPSDVDVVVDVESGDADVYVLPPCSPASAPCDDPSDVEGKYAWASWHGSGPEEVFISREFVTNTSFGTDKFFRVGVHGWAQHGSRFRISVEAVPESRAMVKDEKDALDSIYNKCCNGSDSCAGWKTIKSSDLDYCHSGLASCTKSNSTRQLNLQSQRMDCELTRADFATFGSSITRLYLNQPANLSSKLTFSFGLNQTHSSIDLLSVLPSLFTLSLSYADLGGRTLENAFCRDGVSANLTEISVTGANLTGEVPSCLFQRVPKLEALYADSNHFGGTLPDLPMSANLRALHLSNQRNTTRTISGAIPSSYASSVTLEHLWLSGLNMTGSIPDVFNVSAGRFRDIDVSENLLRGSIPATLAQQVHLESLHMGNNQFSGAVPTGLYDHPSRRVVDIKSNQLTALNVASAHSDLGASLITLNAANNRINEPGIPSVLTRMPKLTYLDLSGNDLHGEILSNASTNSWALLQLDVSSNSLNGTIPDASYWGQIFTPGPLDRLFDISSNSYESVPDWLNSYVGMSGLTIRKDPSAAVAPTDDGSGLTKSTARNRPSTFLVIVFVVGISTLSTVAGVLALYVQRSRRFSNQFRPFQTGNFRGVELT